MAGVGDLFLIVCGLGLVSVNLKVLGDMLLPAEGSLAYVET